VVVVLAVGVSVLGVAGSAQAYFAAKGGGTASGSTGTVQNLTATATTTTLLYPGISNVDVTLTVTNPNSRPVSVSAVSVAGAITGCTTPAVTFVVKATDLPFTVPVGPNNAVTLHGALAMGTTASSNCQGASISVPLSLSGKLS
jgi:hypothetical protein